MTLGDKLSKLRRDNNYTQEQLANVLGVSRQAIGKWESDTAYPETDRLIRMSELFNCSLDYLLKDTVEQKESIFISSKIYIIDVNKRKLAAFDEFGIDTLAFNNNGEGDLVSGIGKNNTKVKIPVCALYGIKKGILGIGKRTILGYYASLEAAQKEMMDISKASKINTLYELKYAAKMQGVRIVDSNE